MPLEPYQYQPAPSKASTPSPTFQQGNHARRSSASSLWSSPDSPDTRATTPNHSPLKHHGRDLLPRIRPCDQTFDNYVNAHALITPHRRAQSHDVEAPTLAIPETDFYFHRGFSCPPEAETIPTPISATSTADSFAFSTIETPANFHAAYASSDIAGHGRSISTSSLDVASIRRHAFPYRSLPVYVTQDQSAHFNASAIAPQLADFVSNPFPITVVPAAPTHPLQRELTPEFLVETGSEPTTTLREYLTSANPAVHLVPGHARSAGDRTVKHCWWDIRQVQTWEDFNYESIMSISSFPQLLDIPINTYGLPAPEVNNGALYPQSLNELHETYDTFYSTKLNAALKAAQGTDRHAYMRPAQTSRDGPHFLCNYVNNKPGLEYDSEISSSRGRAVGLVKPYEAWNTGMRRDGGPTKQIQYLNGLAQLQWMMREQSCRYGYILTEIELVCVRMGTEPESKAPFFGFMEVSNPIPISKHANDGDQSETPKLTACLALWYLHMLTCDSPLPGQQSWKVHIGAPAEKTRAKVKADEKDGWIRKVKEPQTPEKRKALRQRGWVWPSDEYKAKLEGGIINRSRRAKR